MEIDDLKCLICNEFFNESTKTPRLLISCGHTYCQECLKYLYEKGENNSILCPEDKTFHNLIQIEELPINITLMKLISKKKVTFQQPFRQSNSLFQTPPNNLNPTPGIQLYSGELSRNSIGGKMDDKYESIRKKSRKSHSIFNNDEFGSGRNEMSKTIELCVNHKRPLEVVCVDDRVKICTNCALFGDHKNHDIRNEEEVLIELCTKAEILLESLEIIDFSLENYEKREQVDRLDFIFTEKYNLLLSKVDSYYKDFKKIIKARKENMIAKIKGKFEEINQRIQIFKKFPQDLEQKIATWRKKVKGKLDVVAEINDSNEIDYELLGKKADEQQIDLITESAEFIKEIEKLKLENTNDIEKLVENIDVEWNKSNIKFDNFCFLIENSKLNENVLLLMEENSKNHFSVNLNNVNENILNFNDQCDFEPRISIIGMKNESNIPLVTNHNTSEKKLLRGTSKDNNLDKNSSSKKAQPLISQYLKEFSHASISTKANETMNFKLDDSFNVNFNNSSTLNISQDISINNKNKMSYLSKSKLSNDKIVFIKNQFKNEYASFNCYGDEGAKIVAELIKMKNCKVKDLKMTKTNISDEGMIYIFRALESNTSVINLNLSKNLITDQCFENFTNCLKANKTLKTINLSLNLLSQPIKEKLKISVRSNIKLTL